MKKFGIALMALTLLGATQIQPASATSLSTLIRRATRTHTYARTYVAPTPYYTNGYPYGYNGYGTYGNGIIQTNPWNPNQYTDQFGQWHDAGADPTGGATGIRRRFW